MSSLPSSRVYELWLQVIRDEKLYNAVLAGTHTQLGRPDLDEEAIAILDSLHSDPVGLRWNIENLRFRSALEVGAVVTSYLPRTAYLLTLGNEDWMQELAYEYLAHHEWTPLGHKYLSECERFVAYVRSRVIKRRMTSPHLEPVLQYELAVVQLIRQTADVPADAWPDLQRLDGCELPAVTPRRSPVQTIIELDVDLRPWIESANPAVGKVGPDPVTILVHIPSLAETHRIKTISDGVRVVLEACDGERTVEDIARQLEDEYGLPGEDVQRLVRALLDERILCV